MATERDFEAAVRGIADRTGVVAVRIAVRRHADEPILNLAWGSPPSREPIEIRAVSPRGDVGLLQFWPAVPRADGAAPLELVQMLTRAVDVPADADSGWAYPAPADPDGDDTSESDVIFRAIFHASQDAIGVSINGIHRMVNPSYLQLFGYDSASEIIGRPILDLIAPSARPGIRDYIARRALGLPLPSEYETRGLRKDGTSFDMEVHVSGYRYRGIVYTLALLRDVTLTRQTQETLAQSREFYRALFEVNTAIKIILDPETLRFVDANAAACQFYGYSVDELRAKLITDINPSPEEVIRRNMRLTLEGKRTHFEFRHRLRSGELRDVEIYSGPIDVQGRNLLLSIVHDVTERKRLAEQLREAHKLEAVGRLAGGIAHDFNNLLTTMIGYGSLIVEETPLRSSVHENAQQMVKAARRAEQMTRQLLAFGRRQVLQPRVVSLNAVLDDMAPFLRRAVGDAVHVSLELSPDIADVSVDPGQLTQVIVNLAVNARDAMASGGRLVIRTRDSKTSGAREVVLEVEDDGAGMDDATQARIFEPFFTTKKGQGTGLGLATVYGVVQQSGGRIVVHSAPGQGARFMLSFPAAQEAAAVESAPPAAVARARAGTVLAVEDQDDVRGFLVSALRSGGHTVIEAKDGLEALDVSARFEGAIDLVVTDVVMPGLTGPELVTALRLRRPGVKAVFVSGHHDGLVPEDDVARGAAVFLQKPFSRQQLDGAIARMLAG